MKYILITSFFLFSFFQIEGQIKVKQANKTDFTPKNLISDIFLGEGIDIIDIKYDGKENSVGEFTYGPNSAGLQHGIIMTSGVASLASIPNYKSDDSSPSTGNQYTDSDLANALGNKKLRDISRFEIIFIPHSDSISFNYIFASEEYTKYSCDKYNDGFGFFISKKNSLGEFGDVRNIAILPTTQETVSIENIHPKTDKCAAKNEIFYNDTPEGSTIMTYNGYLNVLTASSRVTPCDTYKIKLIIADIEDQHRDSAVFLEAKSLKSNVLKTAVFTKNNDNNIIEGCSDAKITFYFNNSVSEDYQLKNRVLLNPTLGNIANEGIDYSIIPENSVIKKGEKSFTFNISAFEDFQNEGQEIIAIEYQKNFCNKDTLYLNIRDNNLSNINLSDSIHICQFDTININATLQNSINENDYIYINNNEFHIPATENGQVVSKIKVSNMYSDNLQLNLLQEICIDTLISKKLVDLDIYLVTPNKTIELSTKNGFKSGDEFDIDTLLNTCFTPNASLNINNGNPTQGDFFSNNPTYTGEFKPEGSWNDIVGSKINGDWKLKIITNTSGGTASRLESWHIAFKSNYKVNYSWTPNNNISCNSCLSPDIYPPSDQLYKVNLTDNFGCKSQDSIKAYVNQQELISSINCDSISTDFIRFKWSVINIGEKYEIKVNGAANWQKLNTNYFELTGLNFSEIVKIEVRIIDKDCDNPSISTQCQTYKCPSPQIALISKKANICYGDMNGEIELSASGTKTPYTFDLNGIKNNTGLFTNLISGIDTIFVTDGDSCTIPYPFVIEQPENFELKYNISEISCFGDTNGSIDVNASKSNGGFSYLWFDKDNQNISNTNIISNLDSGFYYLTVKDKLNCSIKDTVYLKMPPPLSIITDSIVNVDCKGDTTGRINIQAIGGSPNYSYIWDTPKGNVTTKDIINSPAGNYFLTLTDSHNCTATKSYTIIEPTEGLDVSYTIKDSLCSGDSDGFIDINIPQGANYTFQWNDGFTGKFKDNLPGGVYSISITDNTGCESIINEYIEELPPIEISLLQDSASCHNFADGKAWVEKISYGSRDANINDFDIKWNSSSNTSRYLFDLVGGQVYTVSVINSFGCKATKSIQIGNPEKLVIDLVELKDASCFGANDGSIEIDIDGGNNLYNYQWSDNSGASNQPFANNLKSGLYKLIVTDKKGCTTEEFYTIKQPKPITLTFNVEDVKCYNGQDGALTVNVKGGTKPYIYNWKNSSLNNKTIQNKSAGIYHISIADLNGCTKIDSIELKQPTDSISSVVESKDVSCNRGFNGEISFITYGGSPPYANKVIGRDYQAGNVIIGLKKGSYTTVTKDINGCTDTIPNIVVNEPEKIIVDLGNDTLVDYGASLKPVVKLTNAIAPVKYKWTIPEGTQSTCTTCSNPELIVLYNFLLGLEIEDSEGCTEKGEKYISVNLKKDIFVPEAFKPSSQNPINRKLFVFGKQGIKVKTFSIYNRWENLVYKRNDFMVNDETIGWDGTFKGKELNSDMFLWYIEVISIDGTKQKYKGTVTLIR